LLAYSFVKNKDSSKVYKGGYITYSNEMKIKELKVKKVSLNKNGAVSYQVAEEMIEGLYKKNKTKLCLSTTGIAGPGGSTKNKPVGLIFIGIRFNKKNIILKKNFKGTRIQIQKKCINFILRYLDKLI
jgi:PncC family amidohydrolase